eukprot:Tamp_09299.p1 GENE.Tamp_09299~~Tamp_09299.p1  ORF type:complete len:433 (-),score=127.97 Tamp_09299:898-2196(-)
MAEAQISPVGQEEFVAMIHAQNEQCAMAVEQRAGNHQALAAWGAGLLQLAIMTDDVPRKKELLRDCRAKFNLAIKVNSDAITPDGQLAIFQLVHAFYMTFIFEESDEVAEQLLEKCKQHLKKGLKKDPTKNDLLEQMKGAWEQRAEILSAAQRFAGKSQEEQQAEYVKMMHEHVEKAEANSVSLSDSDPTALRALGVALVDLSLIKEQTQDLAGARECVGRAVDTLKKSVALCAAKEGETEAAKAERVVLEKETRGLLALALNAKAMGEDVAQEAFNLMQAAREQFHAAIEAETDVPTARQMLLQLRDMYLAQEHWETYHTENAAEMRALAEPLPEWLASLPKSPDLPAPGQVLSIPLDDKNTDDKKKKKKTKEKEWQRIGVEQAAAITAAAAAAQPPLAASTDTDAAPVVLEKTQRKALRSARPPPPPPGV